VQRYPYLSGREVFLPDDQLIVTKTDLKGRITYANQTFLAFCGYTKKQVLGAPHNIVRHPHMPRCVFKLLWDRLGAGEEVFANVVNLAANGDHYWVFAHVTPSRTSSDGIVVGYHSNRRSVDRNAVEKAIIPLYADLLKEEQSHADPKHGLEASTKMLSDRLARMERTYDEYVFSI